MVSTYISGFFKIISGYNNGVTSQKCSKNTQCYNDSLVSFLFNRLTAVVCINDIYRVETRIISSPRGMTTVKPIYLSILLRFTVFSNRIRAATPRTHSYYCHSYKSIEYKTPIYSNTTKA